MGNQDETAVLDPPGNLHISVQSAEGLVAKDFGGTSDPYVIVTVGENSQSTRVHFCAGDEKVKVMGGSVELTAEEAAAQKIGAHVKGHQAVVVETSTGASILTGVRS